MTTPYTVVIAGSTQHTRICAEALLASDQFQITGIITPIPKPIGRTQTITPNPLHQFATEQNIPVTSITQKIDAIIENALRSIPAPDFLLVVDFGYMIPNWLLEWPKISPINIHPSLLPKWRGSSPGQFVLLYGEKETAVSVITVTEKLDQGDILAQLPFTTQENWTQTEYYTTAFNLVGSQLPDILTTFATSRFAQPQPEISPTPTAGRFTKEDAFIPWNILQMALSGKTEAPSQTSLSPILSAALTHHKSLAKTLFYATFALQPWPGLWTLVPTAKGDKRMKVLATSLTGERLELLEVHLEGKTPSRWIEIKNSIGN